MSKTPASQTLPTLSSTSERMSGYPPPADRANYPEELADANLITHRRARHPRPPLSTTLEEEDDVDTPSRDHPESLRTIQYQARLKRERLTSRAPGVVTGFTPGSGVSLEDVRRKQRTPSTKLSTASSETKAARAIRSQLVILKEYFCLGVNIKCPSFHRSADCEAEYQKYRARKKLDGRDSAAEINHVDQHLYEYHQKKRKEDIKDTIARLERCIELRDRLMTMAPSSIRSEFPCTEEILSSGGDDISMMQKATNIARCIIANTSPITQRINPLAKPQRQKSNSKSTEKKYNNTTTRASSHTQHHHDDDGLSQVSTAVASSSAPSSPGRKRSPPSDADGSIGEFLNTGITKNGTGTWPMRAKGKTNQAVELRRVSFFSFIEQSWEERAPEVVHRHSPS